MLPLVTAQTVGSEDGFRAGNHMAGRLKPLDVERETRAFVPLCPLNFVNCSRRAAVHVSVHKEHCGVGICWRADSLRPRRRASIYGYDFRNCKVG
jgi:hypothetical protein